jgi:hypothetical protein
MCPGEISNIYHGFSQGVLDNTITHADDKKKEE